MLLSTSACSIVGSAGATTAEQLSREFGVVAERVATAWASQSTGNAAAASGDPSTAKQASSSGGASRGAHPVGAGIETFEGRALGSDAPRIRTIRLKPRPRPGAFSMNLFEQGDFVHQATKYWCVSASVQTMMNIIDDGKPRRSTKFQKRLHFQGRRLDNDRDDDDRWQGRRSTSQYRLGLHGLGLTDWRDLLNKHGYGPYDVERAPTRKNAIRKAAKAMRMTGRPVGLVVWRGAHAWVMSGFTATADPAYTKKFKVKSVFIQDVWYPYVSSIWGRSRPPNARVPLSALAEDYLPYNRPGRRHPMRDGRFMLVLPELPKQTRVR